MHFNNALRPHQDERAWRVGKRVPLASPWAAPAAQQLRPSGVGFQRIGRHASPPGSLAACGGFSGKPKGWLLNVRHAPQEREEEKVNDT